MAVIEQRVFDLFNRSNYGFLDVIPALQTYLKSLRYLEELQRFVDDENIKRSQALEPEPATAADTSLLLASTGKEHKHKAQRQSQSLHLEGGGVGKEQNPAGTDAINNKTTNLIDDSHIEVRESRWGLARWARWSVCGVLIVLPLSPPPPIGSRGG